MKQTLPYRILLVCAFLWCAFLFLPPLLSGPGNEIISAQLYKSYSHICHQYDARSLHVFGDKLAVCSRCSAVYFGFLVGIVLFRLLPKRNIKPVPYLLISLLPMLLDVMSDLSGLHASTFLTRIATGSFFGIVSSFVLTPVIIQALTELLHKQHNNSKALYELKT